MLNDKVLVNLYVLNIDKSFDVYIPINEKIGNILMLLKKNLLEVDMLDKKEDFILINIFSGKIYNYDEIIRNTDINNDTKLLLV